MNVGICLRLFLHAVLWTLSSAIEVPCSELSRELRFPCLCDLGPREAALDGDPAIHVNCDRIVFATDSPALPYKAPIVSFQQRWAGHQALPAQVFATSALPLRSVDFSGNSLRRLTERLLQGLRGSLVELRLADNLLGDNLNPIFSTSELHGLTHLQILDLSGNSIKAVEEGILKGCENLQEVYLDRNSLNIIPSLSLNGPRALRILSLVNNRITIIPSGAFYSQKSMEKLDISNNLISTIEADSFDGLDKLKILRLSHNRLSRFNSDIFQGAVNLLELDLSENFIVEFPTIALKAFKNLRYLNLSSNLIQNLNNNDLLSLISLYELDLSRNNIANIAPGTFLGLKQLRYLDMSVNSLRTIEDDAFEGLDNLETLLLKDNNILLIPASALGRLPRLTTLQLDYNRVAALSGEILRSIADQVTSLVLAKNVIRELPPATFQYFQQLEELDLTRNLLTVLSADIFTGLESTLKILRIGQNHITNIVGPPIALTRLQVLDLSDNQLTELPRSAFSLLPSLKNLNLSRNIHLSSIPVTLFHHLPDLQILDLSRAGLKALPVDLFVKSSNIESIDLSNNMIAEISDKTFMNLKNLSSIDLSNNNIASIRQSAFVNVMNIQQLLLKGNQLTSFKGEFFNTGTSLEVLDISDNQLSYLFPSSFRIHPRLKKIMAARNKFNFFPAELIANLQFLEHVDLSGNALKSIEELDFARLPRLRALLLSGNQIDTINEMAFHNSTQLQILDLSYNKIDCLGDRLFEGLVRLETLDLEGNRLSELPETIFERVRLQMLENINLARNRFEVAPLKSLQRQYFFVSSVDLSRNNLKDIPADDSILVNIKKLDLSFNPLSELAIANVLGEPKTVRELNLAGTGIKFVTQLETPFLNYLNLSHNNIEELSEHVFSRTTLLETLDLSYNNLTETTTSFPKLWSLLKNLQSLNLSSNLITTISQSDLAGLDTLRHLSICDLNDCKRIEKLAFKSVPNLSTLEAYGYSKLGYLDIQGLLQYLPSLERLNIESKDPAVGGDQLQSILHPRLKELGIYGSRLQTISSSSLSGLKGSNVIVRLRNTSITTLPPTLFFPTPRSSRVTLDVTGSQLSSLSPQMLVALDDRRGDLQITGLETNPIVCDCGARALRRWLPAHMAMIRCSAPEYLAGKLLMETSDDELTCDPRKLTSPPTLATKTTHTVVRTTTEPDIIWSLPTEENKVKTKVPLKGPVQAVNNDDTLIIGIVGGVVAFIAILIIIICIVRLRISSRAAPMMPPTVGPGSSCACSVKGSGPLYAIPPAYGPGYTSTLPHKVHSVPPSAAMVNSTRHTYSTMGRVPYYQNPQPYFLAVPPDEKVYR